MCLICQNVLNLIKFSKQEIYLYNINKEIQYIQDIIISNIIEITKIYLKKNNLLASLNKLHFIIFNYKNSIFRTEALYLLINIYYQIGMIQIVNSLKKSLFLSCNNNILYKVLS